MLMCATLIETELFLAIRENRLRVFSHAIICDFRIIGFIGAIGSVFFTAVNGNFACRITHIKVISIFNLE